MLTEQEKASMIYGLIKQQARMAHQLVVEAEMKLSAEQTGQRLWSENPDNAFNRRLAEDRVKTARETEARWNSVLDHAVETFIQGRK